MFVKTLFFEIKVTHFYCSLCFSRTTFINISFRFTIKIHNWENSIRQIKKRSTKVQEFINGSTVIMRRFFNKLMSINHHNTYKISQSKTTAKIITIIITNHSNFWRLTAKRTKDEKLVIVFVQWAHALRCDVLAVLFSNPASLLSPTLAGKRTQDPVAALRHYTHRAVQIRRCDRVPAKQKS